MAEVQPMGIATIHLQIADRPTPAEVGLTADLDPSIHLDRTHLALVTLAPVTPVQLIQREEQALPAQRIRLQVEDRRIRLQVADRRIGLQMADRLIRLQVADQAPLRPPETLTTQVEAIPAVVTHHPPLLQTMHLRVEDRPTPIQPPEAQTTHQAETRHHHPLHHLTQEVITLQTLQWYPHPAHLTPAADPWAETVSAKLTAKPTYESEALRLNLMRSIE